MAARRGAVALVCVLLPYCWREAELQFINTTTGLPTETSNSKNPDDVPGVFDEILIQEMLEPNKSTKDEKQRISSNLSTNKVTRKRPGTDENYQGSGSKNYYETQVSPGNMDIISNNGLEAGENYQTKAPENYHESQFSAKKGENNYNSDLLIWKTIKMEFPILNQPYILE
nr:sperm acrosome-associated protein 7 isoform X2 [Dasypus novemcinctus]